jgi:hypothetical protein
VILVDGFSRLELTIVEVQPPIDGYTEGGDVRVSAALRFDAFTGAISAWIHRDDWSAFISQLRLLEQTRRGEALLESMAPRELRLRFHSLDMAGHMGVEGELVRFAEGHRRLSLQFPTLEFDPGTLASLLSELETARGE